MATQDQIAAIVNGAQSKGLDPYAVVAVAEQEGLGGGIGDNGSSFGPWQLHVGGAFPWKVDNELTANWSAQKKQAWAWSPRGIEYALDRIAGVAYGESGGTAIHSIVYEFERPADPSKEYTNAYTAYQRLLGTTGGRTQDIAKKAPVSPGNVQQAGIGDFTGIFYKPGSGLSPGDVAGKLLPSGVTSVILRAVKMILGTGLILVGLYIIVRAMGAPAIAPLDKGMRVITRGKVSASPPVAPRRQGDAAAARGEPVARTGAPEATSRADRRQLRANERGRQRAAQAAAARRDAAYGGDDDIPF